MASERGKSAKRIPQTVLPLPFVASNASTHRIHCLVLRSMSTMSAFRTRTPARRSLECLLLLCVCRDRVLVRLVCIHVNGITPVLYKMGRRGPESPYTPSLVAQPNGSASSVNGPEDGTGRGRPPLAIVQVFSSQARAGCWSDGRRDRGQIRPTWRPNGDQIGADSASRGSQKHAQSSTQTWGQMASRVVGWRAHNITPEPIPGRSSTMKSKSGLNVRAGLIRAAQSSQEAPADRGLSRLRQHR